jgi:hypothetical protein
MELKLKNKVVIVDDLNDIMEESKMIREENCFEVPVAEVQK